LDGKLNKLPAKARICNTTNRFVNHHQRNVRNL
jgi:hypothetical protein